jgi:serine protease Do
MEAVRQQVERRSLSPVGITETMKSFAGKLLASLWLAAVVTPLCAAGTAADPRRDQTVIAIEKAAPSVVNIATKRKGDVVGRPVEFWGNLLGYRLEQLPPQVSAGSGVIVDEDGFVLTNVHVVMEGDKKADEIWVKFWDDRPPIRADAIIGLPGTDVALLKLRGKPGEKFTPIKLAKDDDLFLGETVIALGNPLGLGSSVTKGILSAKPRRPTTEDGLLGVPDWLQVDAPINPGNSGGALINLQGEMIGLNVAVARESQGIGFAIPIKQVSAALSEFFSPEASQTNQVWLGIRLKPANDHSLVVSTVHPGSPAEAAGVKEGDVVATINGQKPKNRFEARELMDANLRSVKLGLVRDGVTLDFVIRYKTFTDLFRQKTGLVLREINKSLSEQLRVQPGTGLVVESVDRGSVGDKTGIKPGMLLSAISSNGSSWQPLKDALAAASTLWQSRPGDVYQVEILAPLRGAAYRYVRQRADMEIQ